MNRFIDATVEPGLWLLADWSLRWVVLIGVYAGWLLLVRPRRAALRYQMGLGVLLACLLLTVGLRWGPGFARWPERAASALRSAEMPPTVIHEEDFAEGNSAGVAAEASQPDLAPSAPSKPPRAEPIAEAPAPEPLGPRRLVCLVLAGLWLTGVVLLLVRLGVGFLVLGRLRRTADAASAESLRLLAACRAELNLSRRVALAVHPRVRSPITLGLFRPTVLVPPAWSALPEAARRGSLLHELTHLVRYDDWTALLLEVVRAGFFFHPLLHWFLARLERERELLCDEAAVRRGVAPAEYARMLVAFARRPGRLSPGVSLPVGSPRTVQVRIHHLLEDTMNRSWKPLSRASAVTLALAALGLALGLGSFRVRAIEPKPQPVVVPPAGANQVADEPPAAAKPKPEPKGGDRPENPKPSAVKRERLTYGGKTFDQWRDVLQTELKPELRIEAINALEAFGQHGYGPEAAMAVVDLMRGYDVASPSAQDFKVIQAACKTLGKLGSSALPILLKEMKAKDRNSRRFAFEAVKYINDFKQIRPALATGISDADPRIRQTAVLDLLATATGDYRQGYLGNYGEGLLVGADKLQKAREAVPIIMQALKDPDDKVREAAINALGALGKQNQAAISAAVQATKDESPDNRRAAYYWLSQMEVDAKTLGSLYLQLLKEKDKQVRGSGMNSLGPQAKDAVPALIKQLTSGPKEDRARVVYALSLIGPDAKDALPDLSKLYEEEQDPVMKQRISVAINSIRSGSRLSSRSVFSDDVP